MLGNIQFHNSYGFFFKIGFIRQWFDTWQVVLITACSQNLGGKECSIIIVLDVLVDSILPFYNHIWLGRLEFVRVPFFITEIFKQLILKFLSMIASYWCNVVSLNFFTKNSMFLRVSSSWAKIITLIIKNYKCIPFSCYVCCCIRSK